MPHKCTACGRGFADGSKEMLSGCPDCGGTKFQFMPAGGAPAAEEPPDPPQPEVGAVAETVGAATTKLRDFVRDDPGPATADAPGSDGAEGVDAVQADAVQADASQADAVQRETDQADVVQREADQADAGQVDDGAPEDSAPEDGAQSSARSEMVSPEELPDGPAYVGATTTDGTATADGAQTADGTGTTDGANVEPSGAGDEPAGEDVTHPGQVGDDDSGRVVDTPSQDSPDLSELREELNDQFEGIRICERGEYELNIMELYEREETIIALQENGRYVIEPPESWHGDD